MNTNPYIQVLNAYWSWWLFKLLAVLTLGGFAVTMLAGDREIAMIGAAVAANGFLIGGAVVGAHLKGQFSRPAAQLSPAYVAPHIHVACAMLVLLTLVLPWAAAARHGQPALGVIAAIVAVYVYFVWIGSNVSAVLTHTAWLPWFVLMAVMMKWRQPLEQLFKGENPMLAMAILAAAAVAFLVLLGRLASLTEDDPAYRRGNLALIPKAGKKNAQSIAAWSAADQPMSRLFWRSADVPAKVRHRSNASRSVTLWRIGHSAMSIRAMALFIVILLALMLYVIYALSGINPAQGGRMWLGLIWVPLIQGVLMPIAMLAPKYTSLGHELLRPISRRDYASRLILATAWDVAEFIGTAGACVLVIALIVGGRSALPGPEFLPWCTLGATGIVAIFAFGIWAASLRCPPLTMLLLLIFIPAVSCLLALPEFKGWRGLAPIASVSLAVLAIAAIFLYLGHRAWSRIEQA